jgi:hypothetical protein
MPSLRIKRIGKPGVSPLKKNSAAQQAVGFGYVIIPEGVDRDEFVETCFRQSRIAIVDDSSGNFMLDCYITNEAIQNVKFPKNVGEKGMGVIWVAQPFQTQPLIVGTINEERDTDIRDDEEFVVNRRWGDGMLTITGSAKEGNLFISVKGVPAGYIKIISEGDENSVLELVSSGNVKISANENVEVEAFKKLKAKIIDPDTENESGFSLDKDTSTFEASYGEGDDKNVVKTVVTTDGVVTTVKLGDVLYENTVDAEKALFKFQDSQVELKDGKASIMQGSSSLEIEGDKVSMNNPGTGLKDLLTKIVDAIKTLTVSTAVGPSGTPLPPTIEKTTELESLLSQFFNK